MKVGIVTTKGSWSCATTGKGRFIQRLIPELRNLGVEISEDANEPVDVALGIGKFVYEPKARKLVVRMGPAHIDSSQDYKSLNKRKIKAIKHSDGVIYQSEWCRKVGHKFMVPHWNEAVIFNGAPILGHKSFPDNPVFITATRKWIPQKRLKDLIRAFFDAQIDNSVLRVFGEFGYKEDIKNSFSESVVSFGGLVQPDVLQSHMREATAFLHPVLYDACPNAVVEALACGLPILCGDQGGTREIVDSEHPRGWVCKDKLWDFKPVNLNDPPRLDINEWAEGIRILANYRTTVPNNQHIDIKNIAKQYANFFQKVLNG